MINLPHPDNGPQTDESILRTKEYSTVRLGVHWPDDMKFTTLKKDEVLAILDGKDLVSEGEGFSYDGISYQDTWAFLGDRLIVSYASLTDDCDQGEGWIGSLTGVDFVEFDP